MTQSVLQSKLMKNVGVPFFSTRMSIEPLANPESRPAKVEFNVSG